jgi:hypothetical protein
VYPPTSRPSVFTYPSYASHRASNY